MMSRSRVFKTARWLIKRLPDYLSIRLFDYSIIQLHCNQLIEYIRSLFPKRHLSTVEWYLVRVQGELS